MIVNEMERRGLFLLSEKWNGTQDVYRGILEIVCRFGFISIEEVMYGLDLSEQKAKDRLKYLTRVGLLERFESFTVPQTFFCLSLFGRQMAQAHGVSDEILNFRPSDYYAPNHRHDRMLTRIYLALRKIFPDDLKGWMGERTLRQNENLPFSLPGSSNSPWSHRVLDGLFLLQMKKETFTEPTGVRKSEGGVSEFWWCGLELELTLKSAERYRKQFKGLAEAVYDAFEKKQKIPLVFFLYGTPAIGQALRTYWSEQRVHYGRCLFLFGPADKFLEERERAPLTRCLGSDERPILASEMNRVKVKMTLSQVAAS